MKKGVELTMNTIIIAAIALIAVVVIIAIFTDWMNRGNQDLGSISACESMGNGEGNCFEKSERPDNHNCVFRYGGCDEERGQYCCWPK